MAENQIKFQPTPNPNSMKFIFNKQVVQSGMAIFNNKEEAENSEIAARLFEIDGLVGVFMMENFVSVNKIPGGNWGIIVPKVMDILKTL